MLCFKPHPHIFENLVFCGTVCVWFYGQLTSDLFFRAYWCTFKGLIVAHTHNNTKVSIPSTTLALNCSNQYKTIKIKGTQSAVIVYLRKSERETFRMLIAILLLCCTLNQAEADIIQNYRWLLNHNTHTHTHKALRCPGDGSIKLESFLQCSYNCWDMISSEALSILCTTPWTTVFMSVLF